jgi:hypothetical protein
VTPADQQEKMPKLHAIAATLAAALCAFALSVGAALAEGHKPPPAKKGERQLPPGLCILEEL